MILTTKELCMCAITGALLFVGFSLGSNILYLEIITNLIVLVSLIFKKKLAILSIIVFSACLVFNVGLNIYTSMYLIVYVLYGILTIALKDILLKHQYFKYIYIGVLSFMTGQILQLPHIIATKGASTLYLLLGIKTSLIQGCLSFVFAMLVFDLLYDRLKKVLKGDYQ